MDNLNVEGQANSGAEGSPSQTVSNSTPASIDGADALAKLLEAKLDEKLKPLYAEVRGVQGRQDKDRSAFKEFLDEYKNQKAKGLSDADAEIAADQHLKDKAKEAQKDELLQKLAEKVLGASGVGNTQPAHADIVNQYGLDANDPEVIQNVLSQTDKKDAKIAALEILNKRATRPTPNPAVAATIPTHAPLGTMSDKAMREAYIKEFSTARGNKALGKEIQDKYRKMGFDPGSVGFSV